MKALCLVAHPDDCVIFGYSYMWHHWNLNWTVAYLTYTQHHDRGQEFAGFWQRRKVPTIFLGFLDHYHDQEQQKFLHWDPKQACHECWHLAQPFDLVLTHDALGDYGHIHHCLVHQAVVQHPNRVVFSRPGQGQEYILPSTAYDLEELPLHQDIIKNFHPTVHKNCYQVLS